MQTWLNLQDKVITVTDGASGIDLAIVGELLAQGANVRMVDTHGGNGQYKSHEGYQFWPTGISSVKEINHTVAEIIQRFSRIDGLANNAGVNFSRLLVNEKAPARQCELNEATFEKMVNIDQKGVFLISQAVTRQMVKQHDGVIVNASSEGRLGDSESQSYYAVTRAALNSFTRSWSKELGRHGVRVVGVASGIPEKTGLRTPEYEEALAWARDITIKQLREDYTKNAIPIGRTGRLTGMADSVCYLLSERTSYITGVTTNIAGSKTRGQGGFMVNTISYTHGRLACAILESVRTVYGDVRVEAVEFVPGENAGDTVAKLEKSVSIHNQDEWLVAVDLQCDSPWNAAVMLAMHSPRLQVISGLSLPLALELVDNRDSMNIDELCEHLMQIAKQIRVVWRRVTTAEEGL